MDENELQFDRFMEASSLDRFNIQQFSQQLNAYDSEDKQLLLEFPANVQPLPVIKSKLNSLAKKRQSNRAFTDKALSKKELSKILSSFYAWNGLEHRGYPSAGATYVTEVFGFGLNVEAYTGKTFYYDPEQHGVVTLANNAPSWEEASETLNMNIEGTPQLLLVFVVFPSRVTAKYGERGGRFALVEAGAALQQLSLQIADSSSLKGVAIGGMLDNVWKQRLGLQSSEAQIVAGYLVGK